MGGEVTWIIDKVSACCDSGTVGVSFLWSNVDNNACISHRLVLRYVGDFFVSHNKE
jgi:hypothetical protein